MIHIVLADDHTLLRAGLRDLLERHREFHVGRGDALSISGCATFTFSACGSRWS
jgi:DNA-binding NarL/FixJ family response regulator